MDRCIALVQNTFQQHICYRWWHPYSLFHSFPTILTESQSKRECCRRVARWAKFSWRENRSMVFYLSKPFFRGRITGRQLSNFWTIRHWSWKLWWIYNICCSWQLKVIYRYSNHVSITELLINLINRSTRSHWPNTPCVRATLLQLVSSSGYAVLH